VNALPLPLTDQTARIIRGDCAEVLRSIPDCSIDAIVTDPPAGISFMGKAWDDDKGGRDQWIAWLRDVMRECLRVLKPGGHALVWALPRTSHWTATAIEDAGFEVRDRVAHFFGQGFPKSLDVSKAIDARLGKSEERKVTGKVAQPAKMKRAISMNADGWSESPDLTAPATPEAARWSGWGTSLKPAVEDYWLARKPLEGTVAANVLAHGTGGLNVDGCRIGTSKAVPASGRTKPRDDGWGMKGDEATPGFDPNVGRWPAHVTLDEEAARMLDAQSGTLKSGAIRAGGRAGSHGGQPFGELGVRVHTRDVSGDSGGASRFYYVAKASKREKTAHGTIANNHPTTKPVTLMRWLARLITPPGGVVLDPFAGSGTTGVACAEEGFSFIGIEQDAEHFETARQRIELVYGTVEVRDVDDPP
jgi:hypothetical protein